eukprot:4408225-Amphidinium_carterae.1
MEFERGWLLGPFASIGQLKSALCDVPIVSRRFAIRQGDKIRAIDDLSESGVNLCFAPSEKLFLMDGDCIASFVRVLEQICSGELQQFVLSDGTVKPVVVHPDWFNHVPAVG